MPTTPEARTPNPANLARRLRQARERRELGEQGVTAAFGNVLRPTIGDQLDEKNRDALLEFKKRLIADVLNGTPSDVETESTPVASAEEAVAAFDGDQWGGMLFTTLEKQGFTSSILEFKTDTIIQPSVADNDETAERKPSRPITIDNQLTYMISVLRGEEEDDDAIIAAVAEPVPYKRGNATLVWRNESGVALPDALDPAKGRKHARSAGRCRAVNHTTNPDGTPDQAGHLDRILARLHEPAEKFLREAK